MANVKVDLGYEPIYDGMSLTFKAPCDCTDVSGLVVLAWEAGENSSSYTSYTFQFKDAHGNTLENINDLFSSGVYVKVILDTVNNFAYIQNADTNAYLEGEFDKKVPKTTTINGKTLDKDITLTVSDISGAARVTTGTTIPNGSDLDTYTTVGSYAISSGTNAASMSNIPYAGANCKLEVLSLGYASGMMQVLTFGDLVCHQYMRRYYNSAWGEWRRVVTDNMFDYESGTLRITTT